MEIYGAGVSSDAATVATTSLATLLAPSSTSLTALFASPTTLATAPCSVLVATTTVWILSSPSSFFASCAGFFSSSFFSDVAAAFASLIFRSHPVLNSLPNSNFGKACASVLNTTSVSGSMSFDENSR